MLVCGVRFWKIIEGSLFFVFLYCCILCEVDLRGVVIDCCRKGNVLYFVVLKDLVFFFLKV